MVYEIIIKGDPVPKSRPRMTKGGHVYTPSKTKAYEKEIGIEWCRKYGATHISEPVKMRVYQFFSIPKGFNQEKRKKALDGELWVDKRPDIDNVVKAIFDGLNGLAYLDDKQIVELHTYKQYAETPCVKVQIERVGE